MKDANETCRLRKSYTVSIGLPVRNGQRYVAQAVESILGQTFGDFELVICDDGSVDETPEVVGQFADPRVRYLRNRTNLGIPGVQNHLLDAASGDAIVILHDHDIFLPTLLEEMVALLDRHPSVGVVNPGVAWVDDDGSNYDVMPGLPGDVVSGAAVVRQVLLGRSFSCPITACALVRRSAYEAVGFRYDERFGFISDVDLWLRLAAVTDVAQVPEPLLVCRRRSADHEFAGTDWRLLRWAVAIHRENIERFFPQGSPERDVARRRLASRTRRSYSRMLLGAAAARDRAALREGLRAAGNELGGVSRVATRLLAHAPGACGALELLGATGKAVRRRAARRRREQASPHASAPAVR